MMTFLLTAANQVNPDTAALIGYIVMALGLVVAALVVFGIVKTVIAKLKKSDAAENTAVPAPQTAPASPTAVAPGSAGQIKLHDVDPKTAAMLMAIVANKTGKPLNELRFISIKEVK